MNKKLESHLAQKLVSIAIEMVEVHVEDEDFWTESVIALLARALEVASVKRKEKKSEIFI
jgi:hypothetical protein